MTIQIIVPRVLCKSSTHLNQFTAGIIDETGEGVILRKRASLYEHGRSPNLVKLKVTYYYSNFIIIVCDIFMNSFFFFFQTAYADKEGLVVDVENGNVKLKLYETILLLKH